jgi:serine phosphatase RsbU (regulator of sigma subunit)
MEGVRYRSGELKLGSGDRIFLYTDGVTEATNIENQLYGEERLLDFINKKRTHKGNGAFTNVKIPH